MRGPAATFGPVGYHRPVADLFEVQRDVTEKIAATLAGYQGAVVQAERTLIRRKRPGSLTAYEHYLLGMEAKHGGASGAVTKEGLDEAERLFRLALGIDPQLARAYVGLAYVYEYRMELGLGGTYSENLAEIETAARKAIQLDPNDGEAQLILGHYFVYKGLADQAIEQFARAEALAPSSADVAILIAWYLPSLDQPERASMLADRALQLNPNYPVWYNQGLRFAYFYNRQFDKAVKYTRLVPKPVAADHAVSRRLERDDWRYGDGESCCRRCGARQPRLERRAIPDRQRRLPGSLGQDLRRGCSQSRSCGLRTHRQNCRPAQSQERQIVR